MNDQRDCARRLIRMLHDDGLAKDLTIADLLDTLAMLGLELHHGNAASEAYVQHVKDVVEAAK